MNAYVLLMNKNKLNTHTSFCCFVISFLIGRMSSCNGLTVTVPRCLQKDTRYPGRVRCWTARTLDTRFCMSSHGCGVVVCIGRLHSSSHLKKCTNDKRTSFTLSTCTHFGTLRSTDPKTFPQTHRTEAENSLQFEFPQLHRFLPQWECLLENCCRSIFVSIFLEGAARM